MHKEKIMKTLNDDDVLEVGDIIYYSSMLGGGVMVVDGLAGETVKELKGGFPEVYDRVERDEDLHKNFDYE